MVNVTKQSHGGRDMKITTVFAAALVLALIMAPFVATV
jgi:hypothetical protein